MTDNNYKGFNLFNDIKNTTLRNTNRATVLANIAEDNARNSKISPKGSGLILGYFQQVPVEDRETVKTTFQTIMTERGFILV